MIYGISTLENLREEFNHFARPFFELFQFGSQICLNCHEDNWNLLKRYLSDKNLSVMNNKGMVSVMLSNEDYLMIGDVRIYQNLISPIELIFQLTNALMDNLLLYYYSWYSDTLALSRPGISIFYYNLSMKDYLENLMGNDEEALANNHTRAEIDNRFKALAVVIGLKELLEGGNTTRLEAALAVNREANKFSFKTTGTKLFEALYNTSEDFKNLAFNSTVEPTVSSSSMDTSDIDF